MTESPRQPLLTPMLRWFLFTMILANIASQMVYTLLPIYLNQLGATAEQIGLAFSVASVVPLALQIFGGWMSDSIGRMKTIALGSIAGTLGYTGMVLAPSWEWVMFALAIEYVSSALVSPSFSAFIAEQSAGENRGKLFGVSHGIFMVVNVVGPPLGGLLAFRFGFGTMLPVAAIIYGSAAALRIWMAFAADFSERRVSEALTLNSLRTGLAGLLAMFTGGGILAWILFSDGVGDIAFRLSAELLPLYLENVGSMSVQQVGWLRSAYGIAMMISAFPAGWLSDKRGENVGISAGFLLSGAAIFMFLHSVTYWGFAAAWFAFGIGGGLLSPAYQSLISKVVPQERRGIVFGLLGTSLGIFSLPAPWIGGRLWQHYSPQSPFAVTAIASLITAGIAWLKLKPPAKEDSFAGSR